MSMSSQQTLDAIKVLLAEDRAEWSRDEIIEAIEMYGDLRADEMATAITATLDAVAKAKLRRAVNLA